MATANQYIPTISVIMPIFNNGQYVKEAIDSILNQTYQNLELIIINDGSTDNSSEIINTYHDTRIRIINNPKNLGLVPSLNEGIEKAKGEYIARMDGDDISMPKRLARQIDYLESHPKVGICGTWAYVINENGKKSHLWKKVTTNSAITTKLLFDSGLIHPSIIARKKLLIDNPYPSNFPIAEDYALWTDLIDKTQFHNIDEPLFMYRSTNKESNYRKTQINSGNAVRRLALTKMGYELSSQELKLFNILATQKTINRVEDLYKVAQVVRRILKNSNNQYINKFVLRSLIADLWWYAVSHSNIDSIDRKKTYLRYPHLTWFIIKRKTFKLFGIDIFYA